jgi:radical SAM superfamily enzyme YgiQ (UPF0313 family)
MANDKDIILTTINAKWIHPSLALRLLKANLGGLQDRCEIIEFALRQPLAEKLEPFMNRRIHILGVSVSIWNHLATIELLKELEKIWAKPEEKPVVIFGGPEVSFLPPSAEIFRFADFVIRGEGEDVFKILCEKILSAPQRAEPPQAKMTQFVNAENVDVSKIKSAYHLYTDEDLAKKLIYVEASRGCLFNCEFCLSAAAKNNSETGVRAGRVREFPLEPFFAQMDELIKRGAKTFKFLDRTFNSNIRRALKIIEFFLDKIGEQEKTGRSFVVHFEMVPSLFTPELNEALGRFPPGTLRLEIGIQTLNSAAAGLIGRPSNPEKELETIRLLREKTHAIIHADLIAGLPGEDIESFGRGFDRLAACLTGNQTAQPPAEIQLGILKLLPGAPISRHNETFGMRYNPLPPYEVLETSAMSAGDIQRIKNFARFWELLINRRIANITDEEPVFKKFMTVSDSLFAQFGRNWGIDREKLLETINKDDMIYFKQ